jgi:hypothetical protein
LMHMTLFAPVLSATSSRDCIWIMSSSQLVPFAATLRKEGNRITVSLGPVCHPGEP